jgi:BirA family transcriptional regulator, biotin operon repressor / biotin---[acetyl-CoA-carboxylase] ligase
VQLDNSSKVFSKVTWFDQIDSTNLELQRQLSSGAGDFSAVLAGSQTHGQGRLGRAWQSPPEASLSLSIAITRPGANPGWLTLIAALAVTKMLEVNGIGAGIKWPNDVLVSGKKICGILATLKDQTVIIGIGVNLAPQDPELNAISMQELGVIQNPDSAAAQIGTQLKNLLDRFHVNPAEVRAEYVNSSVTLGREVRAELPGGAEVLGKASEIAESGELVILTPEPVRLSAGDVWHLRS